MISFLLPILPYALPPILGAVIGFVTNAIAIRMLFRPLTAKRVFGIRVPFTPGIIPRERYQLAKSIGRMVSTQLLNAETVRDHVGAAGFQQSVRTQVAELTSHILATRPDGRPESDIAPVTQGLADFLTGLFSRFIQSSSFDRVSHDFVRRGFEFLSRLSLRDLIPTEYRGTEEEVVEKLGPVVARLLGPDLQLTIADAGVKWIEDLLADNVKVENFLSDESVTRLTLVASRMYMPLVRGALHWLNEDDVKRDFSVRGKEVLRSVFERLNFFQRFLISAGQYDRTLEERMPQIIEDVIDALRQAAQSPETKGRIISAVSRWMQNIRTMGLADLTRDAGIDLPVTARKAFSIVARTVTGPDGQWRIARYVHQLIQSHEGEALIDIMRQVLGITEPSVHQWLDEKVLSLRNRPSAASEASSIATTLLGGLLDEARTRPLGDLLALSDEQKASLDDFISRRIYAIIDEKLPQAVAALNIQGLVEDKINNLDILSVENLLLMIIEKQLKWINLFGGLLGALIGGLQVAMGFLR